METINSTSKISEYTVTWKEIYDFIASLDRTKKYYGVPRGGSVLAACTGNAVETPEQADIIIDDLIDSGATRDLYLKKYSKPFVVMYDKNKIKDRRWIRFPYESDCNKDLETNILRLIEHFDNPNREGLKDTPARVARMYSELTKKSDFNFTIFDSGGYDEMIIEKNIEFFSLCEHHLLPFFGVVHIGYLPNGKLVGLSKLARTVEYFARGFQTQERLTSEIADFIQEKLQCLGIGVVIEARHLCQEMRGIKKRNVITTTSKMLGNMMSNPEARNEFLSLIKNNRAII